MRYGYRRGFTLIEVVVVVSVIAILAVLVTVGYSTMQKRSRDSERSTKTQLIAAALEDYYDKNGEYPGCQALTADGNTVTSETLEVLDDKTSLRAPNADSDTTNSIVCNDLDSTPGSDDVFSYTGDDSNTCKNGAACKKWVLQIRTESGEIIKISSRHTAESLPDDNPIIAGDISGLTISATMSGDTAVANVGGGSCKSPQTLTRQVRFSKTATSSSGKWSEWFATNNSTYTVPADQGWQYTFQQRARCSDGNVHGNWSSSDTASTVRPINKPDTPSISLATSGNNTTYTRSDISCPPATNAQYQIRQLSDTGGTKWGYNSGWKSWKTNGYKSTTWNTSAQGYEYRVDVIARCQTPYTSSASSGTDSASYIRPVSNPTIPNWEFKKVGKSDLHVTPNIVCTGGASAYADINLYSRNVLWSSTGRTGWYTSDPNAYSQYDKPSPTTRMSMMNGNIIPSGSGFKGKINARCKNLETERKSSDVFQESSMWVW